MGLLSKRHVLEVQRLLDMSLALKGAICPWMWNCFKSGGERLGGQMMSNANRISRNVPPIELSC